MSTELHLELLLGRKVVDSENRSVGRLEEVIAERVGDEAVVKEFLVGGAAFSERFSIKTFGRRFFGLSAARVDCYRIPWDKIDLTHTGKLRLRCAKDELEKFSERNEPKKQE